MAAPPRTSRRRRAARAAAAGLVLLVVFAALAALAVQIVLQTDIPRRAVVASLERSTGLEVRAASLSTGWSGRAVLRDVVFALPLDGKPLATAPTVRVRHTPILGLLFRPVHIHEIVAERPVLHVYEDSRGQWSLPRAIDAISRARPESPSEHGPADLPTIVVSGGTAEFSRRGRPPVSLSLDADGRADTTLTWGFSAELGQSRVQGRLSRVDFAHDIQIDLKGLTPLLSLLAPDSPAPVEFTAHWRGSPADGGASGDLGITRLVVSDYTASGDAAVELNDGRVVVRPAGLQIDSPRLPQGPLVLSGGTIRADTESVSIANLRAEIPGFITDLTGAWSPQTGDATLSGDWSGTLGGDGVSYRGRAEVTARIPRVGQRSINAAVRGTGSAGTSRWRAEADLALAGPTWEALDGRLAFPALMVLGESPLDLSGLTASFTTRWPAATLTELSAPGVNITYARASADLRSREWSAALDAQEWAVPRRWSIPALGAGPLAVSLRAAGDAQRLEVSRLRADAPGVSLRATGAYNPARREPLTAQADLKLDLSSSAAPPASPGKLEGEFDIAGQVRPLSLRGTGRIRTEGVRLAQGTLEPAEVRARAAVDAAGAAIDTDAFSLLGGQWKIAARYKAETTTAAVRLDCTGLALGKALGLLEPSLNASGTLSAGIDVVVPDLDPAQARASGAWQLADARAADQAVASGSGLISIQHGVVSLQDIRLTQGEASATGRVQFRADTPQNLRVELSTQQWPLELDDAGLRFLVDSTLALDVDAKARTATGSANLAAKASLGETPVGAIRLDGSVKDRTIVASDLSADLLGGSVRGRASVPLDRWQNTQADLRVADIDLSTIGSFWAAGEQMSGAISGTITAEPALESHPLGPLHIRATLDAQAGDLRGMDVQGAQVSLYAGPGRVVLDRSQLSVAGGIVALWSRTSMHGSERFFHVDVDAQGLDVNQLVRAADPDIGPTPGRLSGRAALGGYLRKPHRAFGEARLELTESDLTRLPVVTQIYGLLKLGAAGRRPSGEGVAEFRLEGDTLELARLHYFNRGADILATGKLGNVWLGGRSPIDGVAAGALRPLRGTKIPLGADLDRFLGAIFSNAVSVRIDGTLADRGIRIVPLADISAGLGRMLGVQPVK